MQQLENNHNHSTQKQKKTKNIFHLNFVSIEIEHIQCLLQRNRTISETVIISPTNHREAPVRAAAAESAAAVTPATGTQIVSARLATNKRIMSICAVKLPIVRIFKDFDKMSAKEQQYAAINGIGTDNVEVDDDKITIKFTKANIDDKDCCTSSNDDDDVERRRPNRLRKLSDTTTRKRSASNSTYKPSKAFNESHGIGGSTAAYSASAATTTTTSSMAPGTSARRVNALAATSSGLRKQLLVRRSPSPSFIHRNRSPSPNGMPMLSPGYTQYQMSFLEVPLPRDYGDASSDDLSSEWDSDVPEPQRSPKVIKRFIFFLFLLFCLLFILS